MALSWAAQIDELLDSTDFHPKSPYSWATTWNTNRSCVSCAFGSCSATQRLGQAMAHNVSLEARSQSKYNKMHFRGIFSSESTTVWIFTHWEFLFHAELVLFGFSQSFGFLHPTAFLLPLLTDLPIKIQSDLDIFKNMGVSGHFLLYLWDIFNTWFISCLYIPPSLTNRCFLGNNHIVGILIFNPSHDKETKA